LKFSGGVFKLMDAEVDRNLREAYKMVWEEVPLEEFARRVEISNAREEGEEIGIAKGRTEGRAEGRTEGILTVVRNMLADNMPIRDIARFTGLKEHDIAGLGV
jgi:predicted transposase/invertase (TIGR01784 family)